MAQAFVRNQIPPGTAAANLPILLQAAGLKGPPKNESFWDKYVTGNEQQQLGGLLHLAGQSVNPPEQSPKLYNPGFHYDPKSQSVMFADSKDGARAFLQYMNRFTELAINAQGEYSAPAKKFLKEGLPLLTAQFGPKLKAGLQEIEKENEATMNSGPMRFLRFMGGVSQILQAVAPFAPAIKRPATSKIVRYAPATAGASGQSNNTAYKNFGVAPQQTLATVLKLFKEGKATRADLSEAQRTTHAVYADASDGKVRGGRDQPGFKQYVKDRIEAEGYISGGVATPATMKQTNTSTSTSTTKNTGTSKKATTTAPASVPPVAPEPQVPELSKPAKPSGASKASTRQPPSRSEGLRSSPPLVDPDIRPPERIAGRIHASNHIEYDTGVRHVGPNPPNDQSAGITPINRRLRAFSSSNQDVVSVPPPPGDSLPLIPELTRLIKDGKGGMSYVYEHPENEKLVVKVLQHGAQDPARGLRILNNEFNTLRWLSQAGFPVIKPVGLVRAGGKFGLVLPRIDDAIFSKAYTSRQRDQLESIVRSHGSEMIQQLEAIRAKSKELGIHSRDFQFIIERNGKITVFDPMTVTNDPSALEPQERHLGEWIRRIQNVMLSN